MMSRSLFGGGVSATCVLKESRKIASTMRVPNPYLNRSCGDTGSIKQGLKYEREALDHLRVSLAEDLESAPMFEYRVEGNQSPKRCIPDGLIFNPDFIVVVEVKLTHHSSVWKQMQLYQDVVSHHYKLPVKKLEICKNFGPISVPGSERIEYIVTDVNKIPDLLAQQDVDTIIYVWNKKFQ